MKQIQKTAIILVTYGQWEQTKDCLQDLLCQKEGSFRIFVADNGSPDKTRENITANFPDVTLLPMKKNSGFGAANNAGISLAKNFGEPFDSIFILNNDTRIPPQTLEILQRDLSENPDKIIVPQLQNADGSIQKNWFSEIPPVQFFLNAFRTESSAARYVHGTTVPIPNSPFQEAAWTNAAAWMMTVETWDKVGQFDEKFFMYYEDVDWAYRARALGVPFWIDTKIHIVHLGGGSAKSVLSRSLQHDASQLYFYRKHFGKKGARLSTAFRATRSLVRILLQLPKSPFSKSARESLRIHGPLFLFAIGLFKFKR